MPNLSVDGSVIVRYTRPLGTFSTRWSVSCDIRISFEQGNADQKRSGSVVVVLISKVVSKPASQNVIEMTGNVRQKERGIEEVAA